MLESSWIAHWRSRQKRYGEGGADATETRSPSLVTSLKLSPMRTCLEHSIHPIEPTARRPQVSRDTNDSGKFNMSISDVTIEGVCTIGCGFQVLSIAGQAALLVLF